MEPNLLLETYLRTIRSDYDELRLKKMRHIKVQRFIRRFKKHDAYSDLCRKIDSGLKEHNNYMKFDDLYDYVRTKYSVLDKDLFLLTLDLAYQQNRVYIITIYPLPEHPELDTYAGIYIANKNSRSYIRPFLNDLAPYINKNPTILLKLVDEDYISAAKYNMSHTILCPTDGPAMEALSAKWYEDRNFFKVPVPVPPNAADPAAEAFSSLLASLGIGDSEYSHSDTSSDSDSDA